MPRLRRAVHTMAFAALLPAASGCGSSARLSGVTEQPSAGTAARGRESAPLYVVPAESLLVLAEGTPVEVVLPTGARVSGTSLVTLAPAEFRVRAPAKRTFAPPDTVSIPISRIEVAVSSVPLASGSQVYGGPRRLGPLPRPGETLPDPIRPAIRVLTIVAIGGGAALLGMLAVKGRR